MSAVRMSVFLDPGIGMTYTPHGSASDPVTALAELDAGYKMLRTWLLAQQPPARQPVEHRSGVVHLAQARASLGRPIRDNPQA